jgi:predicted nucleic acid-binding protein
MITALDTNILLDVLLPNETFNDASAKALEDAATEGSLVVCDIVYAELCAHFPAQRQCDEFLDENGIRAESLERSARFLASRTWRTYRL